MHMTNGKHSDLLNEKQVIKLCANYDYIYVWKNEGKKRRKYKHRL